MTIIANYDCRKKQTYSCSTINVSTKTQHPWMSLNVIHVLTVQCVTCAVVLRRSIGPVVFVLTSGGYYDGGCLGRGCIRRGCTRMRRG